LDAEDYLDMPEVIDNVIRVDLPEKARKVYDELEDELFTTVEGQEVTALNVGAAMIKCRQVANGGLYTQSETELGRRTWALLHNAKTEALRDLVNELNGEPLLVAYDFQHDLARLQAEFGRDLPAIGGGTSMKVTGQLETAWNAGRLPVLAAHPAAMGHGLNLQGGGHHVAWYGLTYDYELYDQFIRRVRREGQAHAAVYVHHVVARDTVDEAILRALRAKRKGQNALLDALKTYSRQRRS
jgi:SNF2 family DNA or RNA helicase